MVSTKDNLHQRKIFLTTFGHNGIFFSFYNYRGDKTVRSWHTSYPWLNFFYPYWYKKHFGPQFIEGVKEHLNSELSHTIFVDGVPRQDIAYFTVRTRSPSHKKYFDEFKHDAPNLNYQIVDDELFRQGIRPYLEYFSETVVILNLDFFNIDLIEITPRRFSSKVKWQYKSVSLDYSEDINSFVSRVLSGKFVNFMTERLPQNILYDTLLNTIFFAPARSSSLIVIDLYRAIFFELLSNLANQINLESKANGYLFITGELVAFLDSLPSFLLMALDILGIRGLWVVFVDRNLRMPSAMFANTLGNNIPLSELTGDVIAVYSNIGKAKQKGAVVYVDKSKYFGVQGEIARYAVDQYVSVLSEESVANVFIPDGIKVRSLVVDLRSRPVKYGGPYSTQRVKQWLLGLSKVIN